MLEIRKRCQNRTQFHTLLKLHLDPIVTLDNNKRNNDSHMLKNIRIEKTFEKDQVNQTIVFIEFQTLSCQKHVDFQGDDGKTRSG